MREQGLSIFLEELHKYIYIKKITFHSSSYPWEAHTPHVML